MHDDNTSTERLGETFLGLFLTFLAITGIVLIVVLIGIFLMGGFFIGPGIAIFLAGPGVLAFGFLHYFFWGRKLSKETSGEREEEEFRARIQAVDELDAHHPSRPRRF